MQGHPPLRAIFVEVALVLGACVGALGFGFASGPAAAAARGVAAPVSAQPTNALANPVADVAADPDFLSSCGAGSALMTCSSEVLRAIDYARSTEGLPPMRLELARFLGLSAPEQLFAVTNLERTARGLLPVAALTEQLDANAAAGALSLGDASLRGWKLSGGRSVTAWSSNWARASNVLVADYVWMYADATGFNAKCPASGASGCWGHRDNILAVSPSDACPAGPRPHEVMGAALADPASSGPASIVQLFVNECGALPTDVVFTWGQARRALGIE